MENAFRADISDDDDATEKIEQLMREYSLDQNTAVRVQNIMDEQGVSEADAIEIEQEKNSDFAG